MSTVEERLARYREVLDATADVPLDQAGVFHRAAFERRPRRTTLTIAVVALVAAAIGGFVIAVRVRDTSPQSPARGTPLIGSWRAGAAPPFELQSPMQSAVTDDGRIVVLGSVPHGAEPTEPYGGGIYDPATDSWQIVPAAPFGDVATFRLAGTTLVAATDREAGPVSAAMLDLTTLEWRAIEVPGSLSAGFQLWTWDGETLAVVHTGNSGLPGDTAEPFTMRWTLGDRVWHDSAAPPLAPRASPSTAVTTDRIAVWGGFTTDPTIQSALPLDLNEPPVVHGSSPTETPMMTPVTEPIGDSSGKPFTGAYTDGAIYDVGTDSWTSIPSDGAMLDIARRPAALLLAHDQLTLVSTYRGEQPRIVATYRDHAWSRVAPPQASGFVVSAAGDDTVVIATGLGSGPQPAQYFDPADWSWRDAPFETLVLARSGLVALSATPDNPGDGALQGALAVDGTWQRVVDAPFANRLEPAVEAIGDLVIVIGGLQGRDLEPQNDTWILDLSASSVTES